MSRVRPALLVLLSGTSIAAIHPPARAQSDGGPAARLAVGECVGPRVDTVVQGDYRRGIPDRFVGATPDVLAGPGGSVVAHLTAGTAYVVASVRGGFVQLRGTHVSQPYGPGQAVGWVRATDLHELHPRNCV